MNLIKSSLEKISRLNQGQLNNQTSWLNLSMEVVKPNSLYMEIQGLRIHSLFNQGKV